MLELRPEPQEAQDSNVPPKGLPFPDHSQLRFPLSIHAMRSGLEGFPAQTVGRQKESGYREIAGGGTEGTPRTACSLVRLREDEELQLGWRALFPPPAKEPDY